MVLPIYIHVASYNSILYSVYVLNAELRITQRETSMFFVQQKKMMSFLQHTDPS